MIALLVYVIFIVTVIVAFALTGTRFDIDLGKWLRSWS